MVLDETCNRDRELTDPRRVSGLDEEERSLIANFSTRNCCMEKSNLVSRCRVDEDEELHARSRSSMNY